MNNYEQYVKIINKIFECTNLMKEALPDQDNLAYIEAIEEYKETVKASAKNFSKKKTGNVEELGK